MQTLDHDDVSCLRCGSPRVIHIRRKRRRAPPAWRNHCLACGHEGEYIPSLSDIRRACRRLRRRQAPRDASDPSLLREPPALNRASSEPPNEPPHAAPTDNPPPQTAAAHPTARRRGAATARRISPITILQVRNLAAQGVASPQIARLLGLPATTVRKLRMRRYQLAPNIHPRTGDEEELPSVWCPNCRCHVYPPCVACRLKARVIRSAAQARLSTADGARRAVPPRPASPAVQATLAVPPPSPAGDTDLAAALALSISRLPLPLRLVNRLQSRGIFTVHDLLRQTPQQLLNIPDFGPRSLELVFQALARLGLTPTTSASSA